MIPEEIIFADKINFHSYRFGKLSSDLHANDKLFMNAVYSNLSNDKGIHPNK